MAKPLTIQDSTAVNAMIQKILHRAETGKWPDEHTIALRMLAAPFAGPEHVMSFATAKVADAPSANGSNGSSGDDKFDQLVKLMTNDTLPPDQQVANGMVPKAPVVTVRPSDATYDLPEVKANYTTLEDAMSMCTLYSNLIQVQQYPRGFDINTEANLAFNFQAQTAYNAMTGPMAGFYNFSLGTDRTYSNTLNKSDIHGNFLGNLFEDYRFDDDTTKSLDAILTNFVSSLQNINTDKNPTQTQDFALLLNLCPQRNVSGDDKNPVMIYQPTTHLLKMEIDTKTYSQSVSKNNSVDKVDFNFHLTTTNFELNVPRFEANRPKFDQIFQTVTASNLNAYSTLLAKDVKSSSA